MNQDKIWVNKLISQINNLKKKGTHMKLIPWHQNQQQLNLGIFFFFKFKPMNWRDKSRHGNSRAT